MIKKILVLGSGALKIGQAGEFDYSGSQALKALKEEGIKTIVINPNIATVQTSRHLADKVYFVPVDAEFVGEVIKKERPDGILLSFGGQTGLNCGMQLHKKGILQKYKVTVLGTPIESIVLTEDRQRFATHLKTIGSFVPRSSAVTSVAHAKKAAAEIGYPVMIRAGYALGGQSSGVVRTEKELVSLAQEAFSFAPQILVEQYLHHFKEIEYEIVRDRDDNCITVCNMENFDPLGIHTGESIVVAPSQTLSNTEYHQLRRASIDIIRSLGIVGECNIQYALNPKPKNGSVEYYVIEVNARLSRSSALASKATGYPLAYVAAKLALGKRLWEIQNQVTKVTQSFFEPAMDYIVVKIPRWDIAKFKGAHERLGSSMKSVGEVMGIGRSFPEALQKAVRMLDLGVDGVVDCTILKQDNESLSVSSVKKQHIEYATPRRLFALTYMLYSQQSVDELYAITGIDKWFLFQLAEVVKVRKKLQNHPKFLQQISAQSRAILLELKENGFSDKQIGSAVGVSERQVRTIRKKLNVTPSFFQIDTLAGEFPAKTNYIYSTYHGSHHDIQPLSRKGVIVLGSGPYRIGSSVEFDWTAVGAAARLSHFSKKSIIVNCNPETVSTDYDMSSRLYFDELSLERVLDIQDFEKSYGVLVSVGGQTPNNLVEDLHEYNVPILGTSARHIGRAENRVLFSQSLDKLSIAQPEWIQAVSEDQAVSFAEKVGYPVLVRPSYVLSGSAMNICVGKKELISYLSKAVSVNKKHPVTISKFLDAAKEIEFDAVACNGSIVVSAISEHIEFGGVHSGDATIVFPAQRIYNATEKKIKVAASCLAKEFSITGPFNIQFLAKEDSLFVIEMNLRASRTFPLVSKATGINFAARIVDVLFGKSKTYDYEFPTFSVVKAPQFSFSRLTGADPILHVEMASTGEVGCFADDIKSAYLLSLLSVGYRIPSKAILLTLGNAFKEEFGSRAVKLAHLGYVIYTTEGTGEFLKRRYGLSTKIVNKEYEGGRQTALDLIKSHTVDFVINIRDKKSVEDLETFTKEQTDGFMIRRAAADFNVPLLTDIQSAKLFVSSLLYTKDHPLKAYSWDTFVKKPYDKKSL